MRSQSQQKNHIRWTRLLQLEARITPSYSFLGPYSLKDLQALAKNSATAWQVQAVLPPMPAGTTSYLELDSFVPSQLNLGALATHLAKAPQESFPATSHPLVLALPKPDGTFARFKIWEYSMMEPRLAAKFPQFKTYRGQGIDDPTATLAADVTSLGFHAQVLSPHGRWYIDPYWNLQTTQYVSYFANELEQAHGNGCNCALCQGVSTQDGGPVLLGPPPGPPPGLTNGDTLHTYRLAVAADGEYTAFHGGTKEKGQAAIVTAIDRVNQVYEADLAIRLQLVDNNDLLVYTDAKTDPYTNDDPAKLWTENQKTIDDTIKSGNYDIGHVFTTGSGGKGDIGSVGQPGRKAQGTTGRPEPTGDPFWIDYVAHEIGHQFGATHTFNGSQSKNASQRTAATAVEPGSGTTIMSYAGIMDGDNVQPHSDPYFHVVSIENILNYIAAIPTIGTATPTGNTLAGVGNPLSAVIPARTPFSITMTANDPQGDPLTYTIEERDLGPAQKLYDDDNGSSPLFRSEPPSPSGTRYFPRLDHLAADGFGAAGEILPSSNRTMHFTGLARDNKAGGGAIHATSDISVQVIDTGGRFRTTFGAADGLVWPGKSQQMITWDSAGTTGNVINAANVSISMSTDGGLTYPYVLVANTPNDDSELVTIPNLNTTSARFKVSALNDTVNQIAHPFFDINKANIQITYTPTVTTWTGAEPLTSPSAWEDPDNWSNGVPGPGDTAIFQAGAKTSNPTLSTTTSIGKMQIESSWPGQILVNASLTLTDASKWDRGNIVIKAGVSVTNTATVTISNANGVVIAGGGTWTNKGTMIFAGKGTLGVEQLNTRLDTPVGGVFDFQSDSQVVSNSTSGNQGTFTVEGTLRRSPGVGVGTGTIQTTSKFSGVIDVQSTALTISPNATGEVTGVTMNVAPAATLTLGYPLNFSGNLTGTGGGTVRWAGGTQALAGDTTLNFPGSMLQWVSGDLNLNGKTLTNPVGSTITLTGQGFQRLTGNGSFINKGSYISVSTSSIFVNGAGTSLINDVGALIDLRNAGGISYESVSGMFTNAGTIRHSVGTGNATIQCNFSIGGTLEVQSGKLTLSTLAGSTGTATNVAATIDKSATLDLTGLSNTVNYAGNLTCVGGPNGIGIVTTGVFGQINIISDTTFSFPDNMFQWVGGSINIAAGASLFNPSGSFMTLANGGAVTLNGGGTLVNNGWMRHTGFANLVISGVGTMLKNGLTGTYDLQTDADLTFSGTSGTFLNRGVFRKSVNNGYSQVTLSFINDGGTVDIQNGQFDTPGTFDLGKGTLQGNGALYSPITNSDGFIRPGDSPGKLTINGNYVQSGTGSLNVELNGTVAGTLYDQLVVNGTVILGGLLAVTLTNPAKVNDTLTIISNDGNTDAVTGTFNGLLQGDTISINSAKLQINYKGGDGNDVQLKVIAAPTAAPPRISNVQINDGSPQRSQVTSLRVAFDQIVSLPGTPASAFELKRSSDGNVVTLSPSVDNSGSGTVVTFGFTGGPLDFGSLADGLYTLTAKTALITSAGGPLDGNGNGIADGSPADDYVLVGNTTTNKLFRLFGDAEGNASITAADFNAFRLAYGSVGPSIFDFNGDNQVSASDFNEFRTRYGVVLVP